MRDAANPDAGVVEHSHLPQLVRARRYPVDRPLQVVRELRVRQSLCTLIRVRFLDRERRKVVRRARRRGDPQASRGI
jgi:hypothetical protein